MTTRHGAFNGFVAANLLHAVNDLGIFDILDRHGSEGLTPAELAKLTQTSENRLGVLLHAIAQLGYVSVKDSRASGAHDKRVILTGRGEAVIADLGYYTWLVGGYGEMLRELADWTRCVRHFDEHADRDHASIKRAIERNSRAFLGDIFQSVVGPLDFSCVADLGCGSADRLAELCIARPSLRAVGIDNDPAACAAAQQRAKAAEIHDRLSVIEADIVVDLRSAALRQVLAEVDLVICTLVLHHLMPSAAAAQLMFRHLVGAFPNARWFLIGDTVATPPLRREPPIFSAGFDLVHTIMGITPQPESVYADMFAGSGLRVARRVPFGTPFTYLYLLTPAGGPRD